MYMLPVSVFVWFRVAKQSYLAQERQKADGMRGGAAQQSRCDSVQRDLGASCGTEFVPESPDAVPRTRFSRLARLS